MYIVGHIALGYLIWKLVNRKGNTNILAICLFPILPDLDLLIPSLTHRGPTHSIIVAFIVFLPFLIIKEREILAYLPVLLSHSVIGDYFTGRVQLFWPVSQQWMKFFIVVEVGSFLEISIELFLFIFSVVVFLMSKDHEYL